MRLIIFKRPRHLWSLLKIFKTLPCIKLLSWKSATLTKSIFLVHSKSERSSKFPISAEFMAMWKGRGLENGWILPCGGVKKGEVLLSTPLVFCKQIKA